MYYFNYNKVNMFILVFVNLGEFGWWDSIMWELKIDLWKYK